jgi:peptidoglycan hydrolase FlgJ
MDPVTTAPPASPARPVTATASAAEEFEAVFIASFLGEMMEQARPKTMGGGSGEQMFGSLLAHEVAKEIARSGGLGLAKSVEAQLEAYRR